MSTLGHRILSAFEANGVLDYFGVPDSLLADFISALNQSFSVSHTICPNEGCALSLATGAYLASSRIPVVYMQNSGLGNATNPFLSWASERVAKIPLILVIGWRGMPGTTDEPQHQHQGAILLPMLELLNVPYEVFNGSHAAEAAVEKVISNARNNQKAAALVVTPGVLPTPKPRLANEQACNRRKILRATVDMSPVDTAFISTTGYTSRELAEILDEIDGSNRPALFVAGAMGHASQIAAGIAKYRNQGRVVCFDGDGAALMHLGGLALIGSLKPPGFIHILINNGCHESVGGQVTASPNLAFHDVATFCGYASSFFCTNTEEFEAAFLIALRNEASTFIEISVEEGVGRLPLARPRKTPQQNVQDFRNRLGA
jgi:phosphonopyruvate decarboxylase